MFDLIKAGNEEAILKGLKGILELSTLAKKKEALTQKNNGKSLVHVAVASGNTTIMQNLLDILIVLKIDFNFLDDEGNTPLHNAVVLSSFPMVKILTASDANLELTNKENKTALQLAHEKCLLDVDEKDQNIHMIAALLRTRWEWQEESVGAGLRFNRIVGLIEESFPSIKHGVGTDKMFCIGGTGAGKSTFLNYMNGTQYETSLGRGAKPIATSVGGTPEIARVGLGVASQTLYPQVIKKPELNFTYCDLAGLADNRGPAERICAASSVQMLSRLSGKIKGILLVLDIPGFNAEKGASFKSTAVALSKMVNSNPALMGSVFYIITKVPNQSLGMSSGDIIDVYVEQLLELLNNSGSEEDKPLKFMLENMTRFRENIIIPNIADKGESRERLEALLSQLPGDDSGKYNFVSHDGSQQAFNDILQRIAEGYLSRVRELDNNNMYGFPQKIKSELRHQADIEARIRELTKEIDDRKNDKNVYDPKEMDDLIAIKKKKITNNDADISSKRANILTRTAQIGAAEQDIRSCDVSTRVDLDTLKFDVPGQPQRYDLRYQSIYPVFGPEGVAGAITFNGNQGDLQQDVKDCKPLEGLYLNHLYAPQGIVKIDVKFTTEMRYKHRDSISQSRQLISNLIQQNTADNIAIKRLETENVTLTGEIVVCNTEKVVGEKNAEIRQNRIKAEIETRENQLGKAEQELQLSIASENKLRKDQRNKEREIAVNKDLFDVVYRTARVLELGGIVAIREFIEHLEMLYPEIRRDYEDWITAKTSIDSPTEKLGAVQKTFDSKVMDNKPGTDEPKLLIFPKSQPKNNPIPTGSLSGTKKQVVAKK